MTQSPNPLHIASMSQQMSRSASPAEAATFNKIALACMVTVALGSVIQVLHPILKDLNRRHDRDDRERTCR
jgi:cell division protein FtsN